MGERIQVKVEGFCSRNSPKCQQKVMDTIDEVCNSRGAQLYCKDVYGASDGAMIITLVGTGIDQQRLFKELKKKKKRRKVKITTLSPPQSPGESSGAGSYHYGYAPPPMYPPGYGPPPYPYWQYPASPPAPASYGQPPYPYWQYPASPPEPASYGPPPPYPYGQYPAPPPFAAPNYESGSMQQYHNYEADQRYGQSGFDMDSFSSENPNACSIM